MTPASSPTTSQATDAAQAAELARLERDNSYLKTRNAQLQSDVTDLSAQALRLRDELERLHGARAAHRPNPMSGGQ